MIKRKEREMRVQKNKEGENNEERKRKK